MLYQHLKKLFLTADFFYCKFIFKQGANTQNHTAFVDWVMCIVGRATLKILHCKSKTQFVKQECNTQNAIELLNYLKPIAPQQLMLRTQVFTKKL
jgi:hypothetical protein